MLTACVRARLEGKKWRFLEHNGVIFPPKYEPHGVKMKYDGEVVDLDPEQVLPRLCQSGILNWHCWTDGTPCSIEICISACLLCTASRCMHTLALKKGRGKGEGEAEKGKGIGGA